MPGGVFVLTDGELWFTDLHRLRGTGLTAVTGVAPAPTASGCSSRTPRTGHEVVHAYDTRTGDGSIRGERRRP